MKRKSASRQADLFERYDPGILKDQNQMKQLAALVEAMMLEIAVAMAAREAGDDQDHS